MIDISKKIKEALLSDLQVKTAVGARVYNVVNDGDGKTPFFVVELDNISANYTKDLYVSDDVAFSVVCIDSMYDDVINLSNLVRSALENRYFTFDTHTISQIRFTGFSEGFNNQLYTAKMSFTCNSIMN